MTDQTLTDTMMKQYLLGQLTEQERQQVEEIFVCDDVTRERILIIEEELIDDYLDGSLSAEERKQFKSHYLTSPQQYRKLEIAKSLRQYATSETHATSPIRNEATDGHSKLLGFLEWLGLRNRYVAVPIAATLSAVVIAGSIWLVRHQRAVQNEDRRLAIEKELQELNDPAAIAASQATPGILSTVISNISVRSLRGPLTLPAGTNIVELWLSRNGKETYPSYEAQLSRIGSEEKFTIRNLRLETGPQGLAVRVRVPASFATSGDYQIVLYGVTPDREPEYLDEYTVQIENQLQQ